MSLNLDCAPSPALLVSVRNPQEAEAAMAGGAQVIDIKEPANGPLGPADPSLVAAIVEAVDGRRPVTAAAGELVEIGADAPPPGVGVEMAKVGLAGTAATDWRAKLGRLAECVGERVTITPVAYADAGRADSPPLDEVITSAAKLKLTWVMVDTFAKERQSLFELIPARQLSNTIAAAHTAGLRVAIAGSLKRRHLSIAEEIGADVVGIRGAATDGDRLAEVDRDKVRALADALAGGSLPYGQAQQQQ